MTTIGELGRRLTKLLERTATPPLSSHNVCAGHGTELER